MSRNYARLLLQARHARQLTQADVAGLDFSQAYVFQIESGKQLPSHRFVRAMYHLVPQDQAEEAMKQDLYERWRGP